jgi:hypothetical protein
MSIKISNLDQNNLIELAAIDSNLVVGGTHKPASIVSSVPTLGGQATTISSSQLFGGPLAGATSIQIASAIGPGANFTDTSASTSIDANGIKANGGAVAVNNGNIQAVFNPHSPYNRT